MLHRMTFAVVALGLVACGGESDAGLGGTGGSGASAGSGGAAGSGGSGTGGAAGSGGISGSGGGAGSPTCTKLEEQYYDALLRAKACSPILDAIQCTEKVLAHPGCGCPTAINPSNTEAVQGLDQLQRQWDKLNCSEGIVCPAVACAPIDGVCGETSPGSASGMCEDAVQE